ncbi:MAG: multicopper oxidase domain-containing protein [Proteobacteria bacterium]|nr:multicopper oxidase domain-containing protein [Pseudomonadota bacterium]
MNRRSIPLTRRHLLAGLGSIALGRAGSLHAQARDTQSLTLNARPAMLALRAGQPEATVWSLKADPDEAVSRFRQGEAVELTLNNGLPAPSVLNWHGFDGLSAIEPLSVRRPISPGKTEQYAFPLRQAGTFLCDTRLLGDDLTQSSPARALIVDERTPGEADRDELVLIEDWRLDSSGLPTAPGRSGDAGTPLYLVNGKPSLDLTLRPNDRLRLRFINACQRNAIALKIDNLDVRVMAIDSQPAEPFLAREGRLVLAPGTRIDAFVDAAATGGTVSTITLHDGRPPVQIVRLHVSADKPVRAAPLPVPAPLPANNLPLQLNLKTALRVDVPLTTPERSPAAWIAPTHFSAVTPPAFRVKRGRTVVLALTNAATTPMVFHLHGHHVRLLDRLDDGWKPFWLDTLLIDAGQTQRIAFAAETVGSWLMEAMAVEWSAPRRLRWFAVE